MISPEVYFLHIHGEQRGPYTMPQIDHLLNCGLISEETLYMRDGMEQWAPVTELVVRRVGKRRKWGWKKPAVAAAVLLVLAIVLHFLGPVVAEGWRETNQHEFTAEAAYWRARDVIRGQLIGRGVPAFAGFEAARVNLSESAPTDVFLHGEFTEPGGATRPATWQVQLEFDPKTKEWSGVAAGEVASAK